MGAQEFDDCIVASGHRTPLELGAREKVVGRDGLTAMAARWREWRRQKMQAETNGEEEIFIGQAVLGA